MRALLLRSSCLLVLTSLLIVPPGLAAEESFETAPVRPEGGDYVPPPFTPVAVEPAGVSCGDRHYDLAGAIPLAQAAGRAFLQQATLTLDGKALAPPAPRWTRTTPAVAIARREWNQGGLRLSLTQTIEYDGFITGDLCLTPAAGPATVRELSVELVFRPEVSVLYHIPAFSTTPAGLWPERKEVSDTVPGVWGGDDRGGLACYVATFRDWRPAGPRIVLSREGRGPGRILLRIIGEPTEIARPITYRLGFIATPVRTPEPTSLSQNRHSQALRPRKAESPTGSETDSKHWQLFSTQAGGSEDLQPFVRCNLFWTQMSDRYATFSTNDPKGDARKTELVREVQKRGKAALAYTTYDHIEEGAVEPKSDWLMRTVKGRIVSSSIGGAMADRNRTICCAGSPAWVEWKIADLRKAVECYGVDGFYVDTSYVIMSCANPEHGHGWRDAQGELQADLPVWSMREVWRRAYELVCRARGRAEIYAHHKGGCPPALAAFTTAFCDGEQYTSQSIKNLTLDAFRAQISGRNVGPLAHFLCEFYRSESLQTRGRKEHHNPAESVMLPLLHDVLPTGYPGFHPVRELLALREDLGIAEARWTPYYAADNPWKAEGAEGLVVSSYATARGDTLLVVGNPTYADAQFRLAGPADAVQDRTFVAIDVLARLGRHSVSTPGYRWEKADPAKLSVPARSLMLMAWIARPESIAAFAAQEGFAGSPANHQRRTPVPAGATLLDDFEDPDWTLASDDGSVTSTEREPVDTRRALRVLARPKHDAAALLCTFERPQDWSTCEALSFWVRPDKDLPIRAIDPRLRDDRKYGPSLTLVSPGPKTVLKAGEWTELKYEFGQAPRDTVGILRIYFDRGDKYSGPFDLDEMLLWGGKPGPAATASKAKDAGKEKKGKTLVDRPGAPPE